MKIHPCFPSLVWECDIIVPDSLQKYCIDLPSKQSGVNSSNVCGSWHSNYELNEDDFFYETYLKDFLKNLSFIPNFRVDSCWVNLNPKGSFNLQHSHPGSDLSLVWYIQTSENCGDIEFVNPYTCLRSNITDYFEEDFLEKYYNDNYEVFPAIKNKCYIFPSDLEHLVQENKSDSLRISMSANLSFHM